MGYSMRGTCRGRVGPLLSRVLPLLVFAVAPLPGAAQDHSPEEHQIVTLLERVSSLMQAGDLAPLDEIYASGRGVHIIEGAGVNHGWEDYRDHHLVPELAAFQDFQYRWHSIEPRVVGDLAFAAFQYELDAVTDNGPVAVDGRGTAVLERIDGSWRIVHTHTSGRPRR